MEGLWVKSEEKKKTFVYLTSLGNKNFQFPFPSSFKPSLTEIGDSEY